jgi:hypothetical protein
MFFQEKFRVFVRTSGRAEFFCLSKLHERRAPVWRCKDLFTLQFRVLEGQLQAEFRGISSRTIQFYFPDSEDEFILVGETRACVSIPVAHNIRITWLVTK